MAQFFLTEADHVILKELIADWRSRTKRGRNTAWPEPDDSQAPEVYIALTPSGGIGALDQGSTGTFADDLPGSAECEIYRIIDVSDVKTLAAIAGLTKIVYNIGTSAIAANSWISVARDKFGYWIAQAIGDALQAKWIRFTLKTAIDDGTELVANCEVEHYWQGSSPGTAVTVYNIPVSPSGYMFTAAKANVGLASYDYANNKYWIVQLEC